jgi:hypothetical protein
MQALLGAIKRNVTLLFRYSYIFFALHSQAGMAFSSRHRPTLFLRAVFSNCCNRPSFEYFL